MDQAVTGQSREAERAELGLVLAALARAPRLENLLRYIAEKTFQNKVNEINEYNIATEVFGRSKTSFDASRDSIARVEAFRLRKRLKEYYETEGKEHEIQISLPPGSYVPVFIERPTSPQARAVPELKPGEGGVEGLLSSAVADAEEALVSSESVLVGTSSPRPPALRNRTLLYGISGIAAFAVILLSGYLMLKTHRAKKDNVYFAPANARQAAPLNAEPYAQVPLRILAGYSGKPQIDSAGNIWQPDQYFHNGGTWDRPDTIVARTANPMLFKHWRNWNFSYDIPLKPDVYELHLFFVSAGPDSNVPITFSVSVNGKPVLSSFDVRLDAQGPNVADERIFRDIAPGDDGLLHVSFAGEIGPAALNAIEILPGTPHRQLPIRLVTQARSFTDHSGQFWHPDDYFLDGYNATKSAQIAGTPDPDLFAMERYGHFSYAIPVDARDHYTLILHFAEFYFGPGALGNGSGGEGSRLFRVLCNGNTLLDNFDIYKEAGSLHALTKTFSHLKPSAQGKLNITFEPITNNATVSGIEVLDESQ